MTQTVEIALSPNMPPELASQLVTLGRLSTAGHCISPGTRVFACTVGDSVDASLINRLPATVELIATAGVETDHIDLDAARTRGIRISNTPGTTQDAALRLKANIAAFLDRGLPLDRV
ncbi:hypothetical protein [Marinobacterium aestuariivivens]|uniref:D-isomer specific 2-hydroxyacid dehydrogenase catalytic domain-containing protein n=1 Tax=Marinobacterium aestuariivivens TaxID=1698799 RepID=A0ABW2A6G0_9GAMM